MDTEDHRKQKYEKTRIGRTTRGSKVLIFVKFWFFSVFKFGMDYINKLKVKELGVLLHYHFGSEKLKEVPKKLEIVKDVTDFL